MLTDRDKSKIGRRTQQAVDELEFDLLEVAASQMQGMVLFDAYEVMGGIGPVSVNASKVSRKKAKAIENAIRADIYEEFLVNLERERQIAKGGLEVIPEATVSNILRNGVEATFRMLSPQVQQALTNVAAGTTRAYISACEVASVQVSRLGTVETMKNAVAFLGQHGITSSTYTRKDGVTVNVPVDVGIRRAMVNAGQRGRMAQTLAIAEAVGHDLVEVNVTANARASHAEWQGKVYSLSGRSKDHERFADACNVGDPVDGIGGYNCGHEVAMFYEEYGKTFEDPLKGTGYTGEEVRELTDRQRELERGIRADKRTAALLKGQGLDDSKYTAAVREKQGELRQLIADNSSVLYRQPQREQTYGI